MEKGEDGKPKRVWVSALTGAGIPELMQAISEHLYGDPIYRSLCLNPSEGKLRAQLYELDAVLSERIDDEGNWLISIKIAKTDFIRLFAEGRGSDPDL